MKPNFSKEQLEYEHVVKYFELRDGELWVKEFVGKDGKVYKTRPANRSVTSEGYIQVYAGGKFFFEHRVIFMLIHNRPIRERYQIHHIYNNKTDNRIEHLEEVTHQVNNQNRQVHLDGKPLNVSFHKTKGKWQAYIRVNGKYHHLGYFKTKEEAYRVYLLACEEVEMYGKLIRTRDERKAA